MTHFVDRPFLPILPRPSLPMKSVHLDNLTATEERSDRSKKRRKSPRGRRWRRRRTEQRSMRRRRRRRWTCALRARAGGKTGEDFAKRKERETSVLVRVGEALPPWAATPPSSHRFRFRFSKSAIIKLSHYRYYKRCVYSAGCLLR